MSSSVSVIVSSYNKSRYIGQTIESVLRQTRKDWELVIVDDASTDGSADLLKQFIEADSRIIVHRNIKNEGANFCRNKGVQLATGKYIVFLDADDLLHIDCLNNRLSVIEKEPGIDFCVFPMGVFKNKIGDSENVWLPKSTRPLADFLSHKLPWAIPQPIWRKTFLQEIGLFDTKFKRMQDVELHTKALLRNDVRLKQVVSAPDCFYRIDEARKNFSDYDFLNRWVESAVMYYSKFYEPAKLRGLSNRLMGTIIKVFIQLMLSYRSRKISGNEYKEIRSKLINAENICGLNTYNRRCLRIAEWYNLNSIRIPGVNWILHRIIQYG